MSAAEQIQRPRKLRKAKRLPVHLIVKPMTDLNTGARVLGLIAANKADRMILQERGYHAGDMLRADLSRARNPKFNALVHGLGTLVRENIDGYHDCADAHAAIKRLQVNAHAYCEEQDIDAAPIVTAIIEAARSVLGDAAAKMLQAVLPSIRTVRVLVPQSLAFDWMPEEDFHAFWRSVCAHLIERHWPSLTEDQIAEMVGVMPGGEP